MPKLLSLPASNSAGATFRWWNTRRVFLAQRWRTNNCGWQQKKAGHSGNWKSKMSLLVDRKLMKIDEAIGRNMSDLKSKKKHKTSFDASRCCTWQEHGFPPGQTTSTLTWGHLDRRWMSQIGWFYPSWAWCGDWMQPQKIYRLTGSVKEETWRNCWDWFRADSLLFSGEL